MGVDADFTAAVETFTTNPLQQFYWVNFDPTAYFIRYQPILTPHVCGLCPSALKEFKGCGTITRDQRRHSVPFCGLCRIDSSAASYRFIRRSHFWQDFGACRHHALAQLLRNKPEVAAV